MFETGQLTLGTSASVFPVAGIRGWVTFSASTAFWLGSASVVSTANGLLVPANVPMPIYAEPTDVFYGIVGTGTAQVTWGAGNQGQFPRMET